jgi:F-type H+-transporting ATPase subunit alpha
MTVDQQVMVLYAGTQGHLDDIPVEAVRRFEKEFLEFMAAKYPDVASVIAKDKDLSDATTAKLNSGIAEFKAQFKA